MSRKSLFASQVAGSLMCLFLAACGGGGSPSSTSAGGGTAPTSGEVTTPPDSTPALAPAMSSAVTWPPEFSGAVYEAAGCSSPLRGTNRTINVGPGKDFEELTDVPWLTLGAGDVVNIFHRASPYKTWIGLRAIGTAAEPVTINGVTSSVCERPVLSGDGAEPAADAKAANFGADIQGAGLIIIHRAPTDPIATYRPAYIQIKNLKFTDARQGYSYQDYAGATQAYGKFTAGIYAVRIERLLVENSEFVNNGLGIFTNNRGLFPDDYSAYITIRGSKFDLNGYNDSDSEHGLYVQGRRVLYEGNFIGQARNGASLKDRSSGTVVRFNFIKSSGRALDLVDTEEDEYNEGNDAARGDPLYDYAWVYGNTIINDFDSPNGWSIRLVHWGHDNDLTRSRNGKLYFFNNSVVHRGYESSPWYVSVFQMGSNYGDVSTDPNFGINAWDNVFTNEGNVDGTAEWRAVWDNGTLNFLGANYLPTGWLSVTSGESATVNTVGSTVLTGDSSVLDSNTFIPVTGASILNLSTYTPDYTEVKSRTAEFIEANVSPVAEFNLQGTAPVARTKVLNGVRDLGAYERR